MPEAAFLSRHTKVASTNPTGVMQTLPSRRYGGTALGSTPASHGLPPPPDACPRFVVVGATTGETGGMIGVVLATSPSALLRGKAKVSWPGCTDAAALAALSIRF